MKIDLEFELNGNIELDVSTKRAKELRHLSETGTLKVEDLLEATSASQLMAAANVNYVTVDAEEDEDEEEDEEEEDEEEDEDEDDEPKPSLW